MSKANTKPAKEKLDPIVFRAAIILVVGALAPLLDSTMVNVALKTIAADLKTTISVVQWITTGYVLAMGLAVPVSGWAVKRFGCKRMYILSLFIFLAGSVLAMLSWSIQSLICFAVIQGIGAGLLMPTLQTELVQLSGGRNLGRMMSIVSIPALLGPILGPVLGGIVVSGLGWRAIFCINIPICLVAIPLSWRGIPSDKPAESWPSLDIRGLLMLSPAFALVIFGIAQIASHGGLGSTAVTVPLGIGVVLLVLFIVYALRTKKEPVLDLRLFKSRNFTICNIALFLTGLITNGAMLMLPLFYQEVRGLSVLSAGLWLIPQGIGMLLTRGWVGKIADRDGARNVVILSLAVTALGTLPYAFADAGTSRILLAAALLVRGAGLGGILISLMASAYDGLGREQIPHASTATRILQTIGGAFGSAILATVLQHQLASHPKPDLQALSGAFRVSFWWVIVFTIIAIIPTLFLTMRKKAQPETVPQENNG